MRVCVSEWVSAIKLRGLRVWCFDLLAVCTLMSRLHVYMRENMLEREESRRKEERERERDRLIKRERDTYVCMCVLERVLLTILLRLPRLWTLVDPWFICHLHGVLMYACIHVYMIPWATEGDNKNPSVTETKKARYYLIVCEWVQVESLSWDYIEARGGGLGSRPIFKKFHETYAPS